MAPVKTAAKKNVVPAKRRATPNAAAKAAKGRAGLELRTDLLEAKAENRSEVSSPAYPFAETPSRREAFALVDRFFVALSKQDSAGARRLLGPPVANEGDRASDAEWRELLRYLHEYALDVLPLKKKERFALDDHRWLELVTAPSQLDADELAEDDETIESALAVTWYSDQKPLAAPRDTDRCAVDDDMIINVCLWGQPTEITATFRVTKSRGGFSLTIPKFKVW